MQAFVDLLPTPWRGFMMAGFAAAYMSTVGTQLNWGASYLVNDFYKRFINKTATRQALRERRRAGRRSSCSSLSIVVTSQLDIGRGSVGVPARARRRDGARADPPLVLVAHQRVERDQRDDRVVRRLARRRCRSCRPRLPAGSPLRATS